MLSRRRLLALAPGFVSICHAAPAVTRPVIVALGDSLTAGYGLEPAQSYPAVLQQMLNARGLRYEVVNQGISGDTSSGGLERIGAALALKPRIVIIELGANDGLRGLPLSATRQNIDTIIARAKASGAKVVVAGMTLPRNYGAKYVAEFEAIYRDLSQKHGAALIPFFLQGVATVPGLMQSDALHPNAAGTRKVAETVLRAITPLLQTK